MSKSGTILGFYRLFTILVLVLAGVPLQGCDPEATPDEGIQIEPGGDYDVRRYDGRDRAWATLSDATHFERLTDDDAWENIVAQGLVTTDSNGEAELCEAGEIVASTHECKPDVCHIFVYGDSDFGHHWCAIPGYTNCMGSATLSFENCDVTVTTLSADVTGLGTWFTVTYLWDTQVTLVIAGEGEVEVIPVRTLTFEGEPVPIDDLPPMERMKAWDGVEVVERETGEPVSFRVPADNDTARYLYTAPDEVLEEIGLPEIVPVREWLDIETLPELRDRLGVLEPRLGPWLERVWQQAKADDIPLGPWRPVSEEPTQPDVVQVFLGARGGPLEDAFAQEALLTAIDKDRTVEFAFPGQEVALLAELGDREIDARQVGYDRALAKEMLAEIGYPDGFLLYLMYPADDEQLVTLAGAVAEYLAGVGIDAEMMERPGAEMMTAVKEIVAAGESVVWLTRR
jgi:hypothetical protein